MSSPLVIPFDHNPIAISVKTASYTIPVGRYARVIANLEGSATITINGATALRGTQNNVLGSSAIGGAQRAYTFYSGFGFSTVSRYLLVTSAATDQNTVASADISNAFTTATDQKTVIADFFCPTGTVISGTGVWRAVVTEYNKIS